MFRIKIVLRTGEKHFLKICKEGCPIVSWNIATTFDTLGVAQFVSDSFWENYWNKEEYLHRGVEKLIKIPGKRKGKRVPCR